MRLKGIGRILGILCVAVVLGSGGMLRAEEPAIVDIPYTKFVLKNGLTLIVHEDHKAPIVAVNVWYHVGSKNEKLGKTGFAHLFEHLMFNGSEHFNDDYFQVLERIGATDLNGTTSNDRTNYFQNVPTPALDTVLWMESDRMGHMLGAIDQAKLDEQRGVVQNEKRQGENQPYGRAYITIAENTYPQGHPYSWSVIGSMEDLNAASLDDVREWFKTYYGAANAVIAIAGDIDPETARQRVEKYFGDIPAGPPVTKQQAWIAPMRGEHRQVMQDQVPQSRIYKVWNVPQWGSPDNTFLDLVTDVLAQGKTSRLYKRLVYDDQIATNVVSLIDPNEIGGQVLIQADARPGVELSAVEKALDEELERFLREGPTEQELARVKTQNRARFIRGIERIGGFGGKSDILIANQVFGGDPDFHKITQRRIQSATAKDLQGAGQRWLSEGVYILEVHPFPEYSTTPSDVDRAAGVPAAGTPPAPRFPTFQRATLSNGLKIILTERPSIPQVNFELLVDAGYAADQSVLAGTASMTLDMMDEGTKTRNALQISEELALLGADLSTDSNLDMSSVSLSALKENLDHSLDLYADVILNPSFPPEELERLRKQRLARIQQEKARPVSMALRVFPGLLYGKGHAYGNPLTGSGTEETVQKMTRDDLVKFHQEWFKPNHATLVVVGATTLAEIQPKLEKLFAIWKAGEVPSKNISTVTLREESRVYIMDRPGSIQSVILAAHIAPPKANPREIAIATMNTVLGGDFTSRMNMNLREDKHWSYGALTFLWDARGQRPFIAYAAVQTDKTKESMSEVLKELNGILGSITVTEDELARAKASETLTLPGRWETMSAVGNSIAEIVRFGLDDNYFNTYSERVRALGLNDVNDAAKKVVHPGNLVWVAIGDREKIEPGIRELNLGEISLMDPDGNVKPGK
ncbi:MAG: insulinase family protein [Acidobacteria bacterium]|nr:insulinase family protein [Acidobacteriota bacterium]